MNFLITALCCVQSEIFSSAYAAAVYLKRVVNFPADRKVYVLGMEGIEDELDAEGIQHVGGTVSESDERCSLS